MELLRKKKSKFYWYDFTVGGRRYRGSTKAETRFPRRLLYYRNSLDVSWSGSKT